MLDFSPADWQAMKLSAWVACAATLLSLPFGVGVAYLLAFCRFRAKALVDGLINLPLVLPPVVVGYLLLLALGGNSWLGQLLGRFGIRIIFTWKAAVIASMVVGFPLLVRSIRIGLEGIDKQLLHAARTLGAGWHDTLLTVTLPLAGRSILAGMSLMFARSLGEFGATIVIAGNIPGVTQTIPLAIYSYSSTPGGDGMALGLCLISVLLALVVLIFNESMVRRLNREERR